MQAYFIAFFYSIRRYDIYLRSRVKSSRAKFLYQFRENVENDRRFIPRRLDVYSFKLNLRVNTCMHLTEFETGYCKIYSQNLPKIDALD